MSTINLNVLTRPFPKDQIRQRKGRKGKMLDYVETHAVIARLNEAFDGEWSFQVSTYWKEDDEVIVLAMLCAGGATKQQFGSSAITREREGGKPLRWRTSTAGVPTTGAPTGTSSAMRRGRGRTCIAPACPSWPTWADAWI